jgi:hypothetical protein
MSLSCSKIYKIILLRVLHECASTLHVIFLDIILFPNKLLSVGLPLCEGCYVWLLSMIVSDVERGYVSFVMAAVR